jgi:hypothetical protein
MPHPRVNRNANPHHSEVHRHCNQGPEGLPPDSRPGESDEVHTTAIHSICSAAIRMSAVTGRTGVASRPAVARGSRVATATRVSAGVAARRRRRRVIAGRAVAARAGARVGACARVLNCAACTATCRGAGATQVERRRCAHDQWNCQARQGSETRNQRVLLPRKGRAKGPAR